MKRSKEFIDNVIKNLPIPELSGPRTEKGKRKVRYNAIKHGLNIKGLLPCKLDHCIYRNHVCCMQNEELLEGVCLIEQAAYSFLKEAFSKKINNKDPTIIEDYIMQAIYINRINNYVAINPDVIWNENFYKMLFRIHNKILVLSDNILKEE